LGYKDKDKDKFKSDVAQFSPSTKKLLDEFDNNRSFLPEGLILTLS